MLFGWWRRQRSRWRTSPSTVRTVLGITLYVVPFWVPPKPAPLPSPLSTIMLRFIHYYSKNIHNTVICLITQSTFDEDQQHCLLPLFGHQHFSSVSTSVWLLLALRYHLLAPSIGPNHKNWCSLVRYYKINRLWHERLDYLLVVFQRQQNQWKLKRGIMRSLSWIKFLKEVEFL